MGRTIRTLWTRVGEHHTLTKKGCIKHSVPRHFRQVDNKDFGQIEVLAIEPIARGTLTENERFSLLCRRETFWIYLLRSLSPGGLNEEIKVLSVIQ